MRLVTHVWMFGNKGIYKTIEFIRIRTPTNCDLCFNNIQGGKIAQRDAKLYLVNCFKIF